MRLHRFFVEEKLVDKNQYVAENEELLHQWRNVFRFTTGDTVILLDNSGYEYTGEFVTLSKKSAVLEIRETRQNTFTPRREIFLFPALIKKERLEWILEKATELGVSHIRPVLSDRSEKKSFNYERSKKIIKEACEQSGRGKLPALYELMDLQNVFESYAVPGLAFDVHGTAFTQKVFEGREAMGIFIGPEGGWSARELALFQEKNIPLYSLGESTLRAETAAVAVLALALLGS